MALIQTIETSQFIVTRDGHLDQDWLNNYHAQKRRENAREIAHTAILLAKQTPQALVTAATWFVEHATR